jgi:phosphosulfolactate phosphohydrolase-like enzyme
VVVTGAVLNAGAAAAYISRFDRVVLVCAGGAGGRRFALDDFAAAGRIIQRLVKLNAGFETGDGAGVAMTAQGYEDWLASALPQQTGRSARMIAGSVHGRYLTSLGLGADINFAMQEDWSAAVPIVAESGPGMARLIDAGRQSYG